MRLTIDGSTHSGNYRVDCACGTNWSGQGEPCGHVSFSPALPIAECVVHVKMCHTGSHLDLRFTARFEQWLTAYWEREGLRRQARGAMPTTALGRTAATR